MMRLAGAMHSTVVDGIERLSIATAAALLTALCWYQAAHSPMFDCLRSGAYLLRTRRGACLSLTRSEAAPLETHYSSLPLITRT